MGKSHSAFCVSPCQIETTGQTQFQSVKWFGFLIRISELTCERKFKTCHISSTRTFSHCYHLISLVAWKMEHRTDFETTRYIRAIGNLWTIFCGMIYGVIQPVSCDWCRSAVGTAWKWEASISKVALSKHCPLTILMKSTKLRCHLRCHLHCFSHVEIDVLVSCRFSL